MALKVFDGFDHYNNTSDFTARSGFLQYQTGSVNFVAGANGIGKAISLQNQSCQAVWAARNAEFFVGHRLLPNSSGTDGAFIIVLYDTVANLPQITIQFSYSGFWIAIYRGTSSGALLYLSPNNVFTNDVWQFVEVHGKIDPSAGQVDVRVRGVTVATISGVNTQNTGNTWADAYVWEVSANNGVLAVDDLYYCDTTSGAGLHPCNTFLGDCGVKTLFATGNDSVQWTPLSGANWQEISETAMDSDTSYNSSNTPGQQDTFGFQALESTIATIFGIQLTYAARKDDVGSRSVKSIVKISGTSYAGTTNPLPDVYAYFTDIWILNPNTSLNWTLTDVNGADYGYNMVS